MDVNTTSLKYKLRKNTCVICETCEVYVIRGNHKCLNRRLEKDCVYKKFNAGEKDSFAKLVEFNAFWNIEADFDTDLKHGLLLLFMYTLLSGCNW